MRISGASVWLAFGILLSSTGGLVACGSGDGEADGNGGMGGESSDDGGTGGSSEDDGGTGGSTSEDFTGVYSTGTTDLDCAVSTQVFVTDEYSIVCQSDDGGFVRITFKDEAAARTVGSFTITERSFSSHPDASTIDVSLQAAGAESEFVSQDDLPGTAEVTATGGHNVIKLTNVELHTATDDGEGTVSATIDF